MREIELNSERSATRTSTVRPEPNHTCCLFLLAVYLVCQLNPTVAPILTPRKPGRINYSNKIPCVVRGAAQTLLQAARSALLMCTLGHNAASSKVLTAGMHHSATYKRLQRSLPDALGPISASRAASWRSSSAVAPLCCGHCPTADANLDSRRSTFLISFSSCIPCSLCRRLTCAVHHISTAATSACTHLCWTSLHTELTQCRSLSTVADPSQLQSLVSATRDTPSACTWWPACRR